MSRSLAPWIVEPFTHLDNTVCFHVIRQKDGSEWIASTWGGPHEDNARLLAAAPDLLQALELLVLVVENANRDAFSNGVTDQAGRDEGEWKTGEFLDNARLAIAKATKP